MIYSLLHISINCFSSGVRCIIITLYHSLTYPFSCQHTFRFLSFYSYKDCHNTHSCIDHLVYLVKNFSIDHTYEWDFTRQWIPVLRNCTSKGMSSYFYILPPTPNVKPSNFCHLVNFRWNLIVILSCIPLISHEVENLYTCS